MANESNVVIRFSTKDTDTVKRALASLGDEGAAALAKLERASATPSKGLLAVNAAAKEARGTFDGMAASLGPVGSGLRALGPYGLAAAAAITVLSAGFSKAISEAAQSEREMAKINAVLKATGNVSGLTAKAIDDLTDSMAQTTLATGESLKAAATQLAVFKTVSGDTFKAALQGAQDLASAGFGTLEDNVQKLGKALDDPIEGSGALSKATGLLSDAQKDQIKVLEESGQHWKAQKVILDEVAARVGGTAAAERDTMVGAYHALTEATSQWFGEAGKHAGVIGGLKGLFDGLAESINKSTAAMKPEGRLDDLKAQRERVAAGWGKDTDLSVDTLDKFIAAEEERLRVEGLLNATLEKGAAIQGQNVGALKVSTDRAHAAGDAIKKFREDLEKTNLAAAKAAQDESDRTAKAAQQREQTIADLEFEASAEQRKTEAMKIGGAVLDEVLVQLEVEAALRKNVIGMTDEQIARIGNATEATARAKIEQQHYNEELSRQAKIAEENKRALEKSQQEFKDYYRESVGLLQESLLDPMVDGFDGTFDTILKRFEKWLLAMAAEAALRPILVPIVAATGGFDASAVGGYGGGGGGLGGIGSTLSNGLGIFAGGTAGFATTLNSWGASSGLFGSGGAPIGNLVGPTQPTSGVFGTTTASQALGGLGAGFAGYSLSNMLFTPRQGPGNEIGATIGGGAGFALGGPLGAFVGSFLGNAIGGLFGAHPSDKTELNNVYFDNGQIIQRDLGAGKDSPENRQAADALTQAVVTFKTFLTGAGLTGAGDSAVIGAGSRDGSFRGVFDNGTEQFFKDADSAFKWFAQEIVKNLDVIPPEFQKAIDTIDYSNLDAFQAQVQRVVDFNALMDNVRDQIDQMTDPQGYALRQLDKQFDAIRKEATDLGASLVDIEKLYGLQRAEVLKQFTTDAVDPLSESLSRARDLMQAVAQEQIDAIDAQMAGQREVVSFFQNAKRTYANAVIETTLGTYSVLNPTDRLDSAMTLFNQQKSLASLGNQDAINDLKDYGFQLLDIAKGTVGATKFAEIQRMVVQSFSDVAALSDRQTDIAQQQLNIEQAQLDELRRISGIAAPGSAGGSGGGAFASVTGADIDALQQQGASMYNTAKAAGLSDEAFAGSQQFSLLESALIKLYGNLTDVGRLTSDLAAEEGQAAGGGAFGASGARVSQAIADRLNQLITISKAGVLENGMTNQQMNDLRAQLADSNAIIQSLIDRLPRAA